MLFYSNIKASNYLMQIDFILDYIQKNNILYIKNDNEKNMIKNKIINYESDILFSFKF